MKKAVILASGGVDSSTVLASIQSQGYEIYAISFNYNQKQAFELDKIKQIVKKYNVKEHKIINIDFNAFKGAALTDRDVELPHYDSASDIGNEIPASYFPARNTIFLSYALGFAESIGSFDIFLGVHATDRANYPDCRPEFIKSFETMANIATAAGVHGNKITIHAPLINMTKTEIIAMGLGLGVDYSGTVSCYDPNPEGKSCGKCLSCVVRLEAFTNNNMRDPIEYV